MTATPPENGSDKTSNRVELKKKSQESSSLSQPAQASAVSEVKVGEYDGAFAAWAGAVLTVLTAVGLILLARSISLRFPALDSPPPNAISYLEQLRGFAVVAATYAGIIALAVGAWLAALEVRGRLSLRKRTLVTRGVTPSRGPLDVVEILNASSKLRGTIAMVVAAVALLLGALWTTGRFPGAASPTPTVTL